MIDAHSSWIGLRASQGVAGSMPKAWHGTGWQTIFNRSMHASRAFMAGRLARQIPGLAWKTSSCHGFRVRRWNYFLEIDDFFLEVVNN
ncbi:hypothetical protein ACS0ZG_21555 [Burkholderia gladioli]|uniref:hypothetical protein n=1 Tax=Burkholderia gladioli TaxID=28095 RepID=UPI0016400CA3|nr:hypothetical protein [Burkholderia gladioli]